MNRFIYKKETGLQFQVGGVTGIAMTIDAVRSTGDVALLNVQGAHGAVKDLASDRFYVVTEGSGNFIIEGEDYAVTVNDVIVIPPNVIFDFSGMMKLVMFCSPPFDPNNDIPVNR